MFVGRFFGPVIAAALLLGCSGSAQQAAPTAAVAIQTGQVLPPLSTADSEYRIGPLDLLKISVFKVPDLDRTVKVTAQGQITFPLIGAVQVGGKTVPEVEEHLAAVLGATYLESPQVSVFVEEAASQRVTVDGAVEDPGSVDLNGPTTLLQAIAEAGGLAQGANGREILVFRTLGDQRTIAKFD